MTSERCRILALPAEVRIEIYRHLFEAAEISIDGSNAKCLQCAVSICSCAFPWRVINACQQLRGEALPYLMSATTLQISGTLEGAARLPTKYVSTIPRAVILDPSTFSKSTTHLEQFHNLRILELRNITIWCKYHDEAYLESPAADECMIGLALFNLNRISAQLTRLCTNKARAFEILLCCQYVASSLSDKTIVRV
jgi:hypothetical protein